LALFLATFAVYAQVRHFDFVNFDDPDYVTGNLHVRNGITPNGIVWALTSGDAANWFPVTRLSHMLDCQLFGLRSGAHHLTSVLLHALAVVLLFAFLNRATRAHWPSAFVAFLFALHPLHVESVAWVAERKDVLSAFFWFLALWAYVRYAERPSLARYLLAFLPFCVGLMAKPMIVTFPFVLLLLDVWPLRRVRLSGAPEADTKHRLLRLVWEKAPFFALSAAIAVATYAVQQHSGAVEALSVPIGLRVENALISYVCYIAKMFWPTGLAVFYPYPMHLAAWQVVLSGLAILGITGAVLRWFPRHPYLAVGWFWYLGTLVPVIGLVQVGAQARADRYTYIPMIGLSIMLAYGARDLLRRWPRAKPAVAGLTAAASVSCIVVTWTQIQYWRNSGSLFQHAVDVTGGNYLAHHNLGNYLMDVPGRLPAAIANLESAVRLKPDSAKAHTDLGTALSKMPDRLPQAVAEYRAALKIAPDSAITHNDLGSTLSKVPGRMQEAIEEYQTALRIDPGYAEADNNLGSALAKSGRLPQAIERFQAALRIDPEYAEAHNNLGSALSQTPGRLPEAIAEYEAALRINPDYAEAHNNLGSALSQIPGRLSEAISEYQAALRIKPDFAEANSNLASALANTPEGLPQAISQYQAALRSEPDSAELHYNFGVTLSKAGRSREAIEQFQTALRIKPDYADAHNNLAVALTNIPGRMPEAIEHFEAALRIRPDYADAHYNLGVALSQIPGRLPEAIAHLEAALRIKPDPEVQQMLGRLRAVQR